MCAQVALQDVGELFDEGLLVVGHAVDVAGEAVVGDHRRDGGKQAQGRGHQGFGDAALRWQQAQAGESAVVIAAEKSVQYETVVKAMDALQKAGVQRVGLSVKQGG